MKRRATSLAAAVGLGVALLTACASQPDAPPSGAAGTPAAGEDHGQVDGAAELDEPALGLTTVDPAGVVRHLDLLDESTRQIAEVPGATGADTDGRYVFVQTPEGVEVVDSGVWTWDHVDHVHYYRADPVDLGMVAGGGEAAVATTNSSTSGGTGLFFSDTGEAVMLETAALAEGDLVERFRVEVPPHDGMLVPVGEHALMTQPGRGGGVADTILTLDDEGRPVPGGEHSCPEPAGTITTRVATVVGCADGALLATPEGDELRVEKVPYPAGSSAPPATAFAARDTRPTVAGLAGDRGIWLLDTRETSWRLIDAPLPLTQVTAVDDDEEHVLGVTVDGRMAVIDGVSGELLATSRPLVSRSLDERAGRVELVVDQQRAYLSAPAEGRLHEIDFADDARVARTFETPTTPAYVAGTGR